MSRAWATYCCDNGIHVAPLRDQMEHRLSDECVCGPDVEFVNSDTGQTYDRPLLTHHSLDGRELSE